MIEKAIIIPFKKEIGINYSKYDFVYTGSEFCEHKIPSTVDIKKIKHNRLVLLTPIMTNKLFYKILELIKLDKIHEITVNDTGFFDYLVKNKINKKINIGRILATNISYSFVWGKTKKVFEKINAIEIDDLSENNFILKGKKIHIHTPFSYLTHEKNCIIKYEKCLNCKDRYIHLKSKISTDIYINSNAYFFYKPKTDLKIRANRIISIADSGIR